MLAKSKLLPPEEIEAIFARWKEETRGTDDQIDPFRKYLTTRRHLTEWQARMVQRGHADGFFIGGYTILDRIGKGQTGGVYKAVHALGQVVALKILPSSRAKQPHLLSRFQREARLVTQLDHPNVVRAFQFGEANGINFIVMEFLEGETLDETLARRKKLTWAEAVRLMHQALCGLEHVHMKRMVHRDLKPANLMLTPDPSPANDTTWDATVKLLDIGLGRELFADDTPEGQIETQLTVEGSVLGTPDYMAPEQAKDARSSDIRADIYSLGCVLYHCLTGRPPFPETNIMTQMLQHATEKPTPVGQLAPGLPPVLQAIVEKMLAKSPDDRYATPAIAAEAFRPLLSPAGSVPVPAAIVPAYKAWLESESHLEIPGNLPTAAVPLKPAATPTQPKTGRATSAAAPVQTSNARPIAKPPIPAKRPSAPKRTSASPTADEVDVELVLEPTNVPVFIPAPAIVSIPERSLTDLDRRDWIMLASGAAGVLTAVGLGYGLARLVRKKDVPPEQPA